MTTQQDNETGFVEATTIQEKFTRAQNLRQTKGSHLSVIFSQMTPCSIQLWEVLAIFNLIM